MLTKPQCTTLAFTILESGLLTCPFGDFAATVYRLRSQGIAPRLSEGSDEQRLIMNLIKTGLAKPRLNKRERTRTLTLLCGRPVASARGTTNDVTRRSKVKMKQAQNSRAL